MIRGTEYSRRSSKLGSKALQRRLLKVICATQTALSPRLGRGTSSPCDMLPPAANKHTKLLKYYTLLNRNSSGKADWCKMHNDLNQRLVGDCEGVCSHTHESNSEGSHHKLKHLSQARSPQAPQSLSETRLSVRTSLPGPMQRNARMPSGPSSGALASLAG